MNRCDYCLYAIRRNCASRSRETRQFSFEDGIDTFFDFV